MKAFEEDDDIEDPPVEALPGSVTPVGDTSEVANALLGMTGEVVKLSMLLAEMDEGEYRAVAPRLAVFLGAVGEIAKIAPRPRRALGFVAPRTKPAKPKRRTTRRR